MNARFLSAVKWQRLVWFSLCVFAICTGPVDAGDPNPKLREEAQAALKKAATYYREQLASHGGYVYHYTLDLQQRWGEGIATEDQIWVQPPGTPTVGLAFLAAYRATGDPFYLEAARDAATALIYGQLKSGGWTNLVDFNPRSERTGLYRNGKGRGKNNSTLDDGISQAAICFLVEIDQVLEFKNERIHEAAQIALDSLLAAQFPNGGFPQVWTGPVSPQKIVKANYPKYDWRTEGRIKNYWDMYTLNDNVAGTVTETLITAAEVYKDKKYEAALRKLGDFLILAQMPEPQPAWAQQYNYDMQPIWARRFEPAGISGSESQDVLEALLQIYEVTGDEKYLAPIPSALAYLKRSLLPDGRLARFNELQTNRPLYMFRRGRDYTLTYDDSRLPGHYGWKIDSRLDAIEKRYQAARRGDPPSSTSTDELERRARIIIDKLDDEGRWVSTYAGERLVGQPKFPQGGKYLSSEVFSDHVELLSEYLTATR